MFSHTHIPSTICFNQVLVLSGGQPSHFQIVLLAEQVKVTWVPVFRVIVCVVNLEFDFWWFLELSLTFARDPILIMLDEPTAGLNTEETKETVQLIRKVTEGKTLIIIEHDMEVVFSLADRVSVIYYGEVLASGPPDEIRQNQKVKDAYLGEEQEE